MFRWKYFPEAALTIVTVVLLVLVVVQYAGSGTRSSSLTAAVSQLNVVCEDVMIGNSLTRTCTCGAGGSASSADPTKKMYCCLMKEKDAFLSGITAPPPPELVPFLPFIPSIYPTPAGQTAAGMFNSWVVIANGLSGAERTAAMEGLCGLPIECGSCAADATITLNDYSALIAANSSAGESAESDGSASSSSRRRIIIPGDSGGDGGSSANNSASASPCSSNGSASSGAPCGGGGTGTTGGSGGSSVNNSASSISPCSSNGSASSGAPCGGGGTDGGSDGSDASDDSSSDNSSPGSSSATSHSCSSNGSASSGAPCGGGTGGTDGGSDGSDDSSANNSSDNSSPASSSATSHSCSSNGSASSGAPCGGGTGGTDGGSDGSDASEDSSSDSSESSSSSEEYIDTVMGYTVPLVLCCVPGLETGDIPGSLRCEEAIIASTCAAAPDARYDVAWVEGATYPEDSGIPMCLVDCTIPTCLEVKGCLADDGSVDPAICTEKVTGYYDEQDLFNCYESTPDCFYSLWQTTACLRDPAEMCVQRGEQVRGRYRPLFDPATTCPFVETNTPGKAEPSNAYEGGLEIDADEEQSDEVVAPEDVEFATSSSP